MPALEINQSVLVNRGLSTIPDFVEASPELNAARVTDVVTSFKQFLTDTAVTVVDPILITTIGTFNTPVELATYFINAKYTELGGASGFLGTTLTAVVATANGAGFMRTFQHGTIYWHPQVGAHEVHGRFA